MVSAEVPADGAAAPATRHDVERVGVDRVEPTESSFGAATILAVEAPSLVAVGLGVAGHTAEVHQFAAAVGVDNAVAPPVFATLTPIDKVRQYGLLSDLAQRTIPAAAVVHVAGPSRVNSLQCVGLRVVGARHDNPLSRHHHGALMGRDVDNQVLPPACA